MKKTQRSKDTNVYFRSPYGCQYYCPECRVTNFMGHKHYCELRMKIPISPKARFPTKNASEKIWKRFENKFCRRELQYIKTHRKELLEDKKRDILYIDWV